MDAKKIGQFISTLRREQNMKQSELAELLGVTNKAVSRWETGRGYPDTELLPKLAQVLGVSITELLSGERVSFHIASQNASQVHEQPTFTPISAVKPTFAPASLAKTTAQKPRKKIILLTAILGGTVSILFFLLLSAVLIHGISLTLTNGSYADCIIESDYSSLTFQGKTYLPLPMEGYECNRDELLIREARVKDSPLFFKLFFGDSLYSVRNVPNEELVYLQTDYDSNLSDYFVLADEYDRYYCMLNQGEYNSFYIGKWDENGIRQETQLPDSLMVEFEALEQSCQLSELPSSMPTGALDVYAYEENHVFYRWDGSIHRRGNAVYWSPSRWEANTYWMSNCYYLITGRSEQIQPYFNHFFGS